MSDVFRSSAVNLLQRKFHSAKSLLPSQPPGNAPLEYFATNSCHVMLYRFSNSRTLLKKKSALTRFIVSIASLLRYRSFIGFPFPASTAHSLDVWSRPRETLTRMFIGALLVPKSYRCKPLFFKQFFTEVCLITLEWGTN